MLLQLSIAIKNFFMFYVFLHKYRLTHKFLNHSLRLFWGYELSDKKNILLKNHFMILKTMKKNIFLHYNHLRPSPQPLTSCEPFHYMHALYQHQCHPKLWQGYAWGCPNSWSFWYAFLAKIPHMVKSMTFKSGKDGGQKTIFGDFFEFSSELNGITQVSSQFEADHSLVYFLLSLSLWIW